MKVSLFSQSLFALDLDSAIAATAELGYRGIELACCKPHFDLDTARRAPERVARRIEDSGLEVSALSGFNTFTDPDSLENELAAAETFIKLAPLFQTATVKLTPGPPSSREATSAHWRCMERALATLVPLAREVGVRLAFETHMRQLTDTLASSQRLLGLAESDAVGLTVDYSNMVFAGEGAAQVVVDLADRTYNTHLKNGRIDASGAWRFEPLDRGWTDYALVLRLLRDKAYRGFLTVECLSPEAAEHPLCTAAHDLKVLRSLLDQVGWNPTLEKP